jgi:hypothetical protein
MDVEWACVRLNCLPWSPSPKWSSVSTKPKPNLNNQGRPKRLGLERNLPWMFLSGLGCIVY